jgi:hypothetical protein
MEQATVPEKSYWEILIVHVRDRLRTKAGPSVEIADSYLYAPAPEAEISAAETRLGCDLPEDYKDFLRASNGTGPSSILGFPGFVSVDEVQWVRAQDSGLRSLMIKVPGHREATVIPPTTRLLILSRPESAEMVGLVEPEYVKAAPRPTYDNRNVEEEHSADDEMVSEPEDEPEEEDNTFDWL